MDASDSFDSSESTRRFKLSDDATGRVELFSGGGDGRYAVSPLLAMGLNDLRAVPGFESNEAAVLEDPTESTELRRLASWPGLTPIIFSRIDISNFFLSG